MHKNICEVLEVGEEEGHVFVALRYLGRLPLRKLHNIARNSNSRSTFSSRFGSSRRF